MPMPKHEREHTAIENESENIMLSAFTVYCVIWYFKWGHPSGLAHSTRGDPELNIIFSKGKGFFLAALLKIIDMSTKCVECNRLIKNSHTHKLTHFAALLFRIIFRLAMAEYETIPVSKYTSKYVHNNDGVDFHDKSPGSKIFQK